ncbi:Ubiquitin fusion degradation protein 1 like protein [Astathelohania contejeani]|uniref:Ubiquitin fusion degradation protein 1 like protein n=1 Tax=Astathelohania contejeani TaxID=164912 RepID=A0ABQ7HV89_9MICR|nr:Ubiquitin fusion degradation protein 1 like protein [Thelohania contejeani]
MFRNLFDFPSGVLAWRLSPKKYEKNDKNNYSCKVVLPQTVLEDLVFNQIPPPYTFEINHTFGAYKTHCGVLEFTGNEAIVLIPEWMYQQLSMDDVMQVSVEYKSLPIGTFIKLLPHSVDFLEIENPKVELESSLRDYPVLTTGDEILCCFEDYGPIRFTVSECQPEGEGIYIVDTDLSVDFLPPIGYEEKLEREKSVKRYLRILPSSHPIKPIRITGLGLILEFSNTNQEI